MSKINIVFDATEIDTFCACPFKYYIRFVHNKVEQVKNPYLDRGDLMHHGKEAYYNAIRLNLPWETAVDKGLREIRIRAAEVSDLSPDDITHNLNVFEENVKRWKHWDVSVRIDAVEEAFIFVLYEDEMFRIVCKGKIDLLFSNDRYIRCPMDTKTYERDYPVIRWRNQFMLYAIAVNSNFLFVDRVGMHKLDGKKPKKAEEKHTRIPLSFDPLIKGQWKNNIIKWAMQLYDCHTNNDWPQNLVACTAYGKLCVYLDICDTSGIENQKQKLNTFKDEKPWDVTATFKKN